MIARPSGPPRAWTVSDLLVWTEGHFRKLEHLSPRLDAEILLAHALGCTRIEIYTGYHKVVEPAERERFRGYVERRGRGEPVAYIVGAREFHSLRFDVGPEVLVPRPETEHLVDAAVEHLKGPDAGAAAADESPPPDEAPAPVEAPAPAPEGPRVLDLGTGSGNIAVAVLARVPAARAVAIDVSSEAIEVARRNAARHGVDSRLELLRGDLFEPLGAPASQFQAILSNPPYIAAADYPGLPRDVRDFEPRLALVDSRGGDGLGFHRAIAAGAPAFLAPGGLLAVEVGAGQAEAVAGLFREAGLDGVGSLADYAGIARVVWGRRAVS